MFLKVLRGFFVVVGLGLLTVVTLWSMDDVDNDIQLNTGNVRMRCEPAGSGGRSVCELSGGINGGGPDLNEFAVATTGGMLGLGFIGAAIALGQFQRPEPARAGNAQAGPAVHTPHAAGPQPQPAPAMGAAPQHAYPPQQYDPRTMPQPPHQGWGPGRGEG
ncbi:hypothetical protein [Bailinhaonella thermotolerans]|nr:hypothetical protein [Bailinhaonella thermotolerans]